MAKIKHGVANTSCVSGTENCTHLFSVLVYDKDGNEKVDCDNGTIVHLGQKNLDTTINHNNEVYKAVLPSGSLTMKGVPEWSEYAMVINPELIYDECVYHPLSDYYNEAGKVVRAYALTNNSRFGLTAECFSNPSELSNLSKTGYLYVIMVDGKMTITTRRPSDTITQDSEDYPKLLGIIEQAMVYDYETFYIMRVHDEKI